MQIKCKNKRIIKQAEIKQETGNGTFNAGYLSLYRNAACCMFVGVDGASWDKIFAYVAKFF